MLTEIVEFALTSVFILYIADAAAAVRDAAKARRKAAKAAKAANQEIPDVCIPDEAIMAPEAPRYQEPEGTQLAPGLGTTTPDAEPTIAADWDTGAWVLEALQATEALEVLEAPSEAPSEAPKAPRAPRKPAETKAPKAKAPKATKTKSAAIAADPVTRVAKAPKTKSPTVAELKALCKAHDLRVTGLNKGALILALRNAGVEVL